MVITWTCITARSKQAFFEFFLFSVASVQLSLWMAELRRQNALDSKASGKPANSLFPDNFLLYFFLLFSSVQRRWGKKTPGIVFIEGSPENIVDEAFTDNKSPDRARWWVVNSIFWAIGKSQVTSSGENEIILPVGLDTLLKREWSNFRAKIVHEKFEQLVNPKLPPLVKLSLLYLLDALTLETWVRQLSCEDSIRYDILCF